MGYVSIKPAQDLDYKSVLIKIARGLHFKHCQQIIPDNYDMVAYFVFSDFERHVDYIQRSNVSGQMGDFFAYKGTRIKDEPKCGIWYLYFYRSVLATVCFIKPKES